MPKTCPECHHAPSGRNDEYGWPCNCRCHDVADAAPALLAACEKALHVMQVAMSARERLVGIKGGGNTPTITALEEAIRQATQGE